MTCVWAGFIVSRYRERGNGMMPRSYGFPALAFANMSVAVFHSANDGFPVVNAS